LGWRCRRFRGLRDLRVSAGFRSKEPIPRAEDDEHHNGDAYEERGAAARFLANLDRFDVPNASAGRLGRSAALVEVLQHLVDETHLVRLPGRLAGASSSAQQG
jgi:hypothetical protein